MGGSCFIGISGWDFEDLVPLLFFFGGEVGVRRGFREGWGVSGEVEGLRLEDGFHGIVEIVVVAVVVKLGVGAHEGVEAADGVGDGVHHVGGGLVVFFSSVAREHARDHEAQDGDFGADVVIGHFAQGVEFLAGEVRGVDAVFEGVGFFVRCGHGGGLVSIIERMCIERKGGTLIFVIE